MSCINIYHPDYIKLLSEIDDSINPFELPTLIRLYQKMNNTDKIPSVSEIYEIDNRTKSQEIPNQIQEVFNENPEFAESVYKALGFKSNSIENRLQIFFNQFGFQFKEGDSSTDLLRKIIYVSKTDNNVFIDNSVKALSQLLLANTNIDFNKLENLIEDTNEFKTLLSQSSEYIRNTHKYLKDGNRIPMEEWVSYIKEYNKIKNTVLEKYVKESLLDKNNSTGLHQLINNFLKFFKDLFSNATNLKEVTDSLIQQVLLNQKEVIINSQDLKNKERVTLAKALEETTHGKDIIKTFGEFGLILTGSVSASEQGSVFRKVGKLLHDIDWVVPKGFTKDFNKKLKDTFTGATLVREFDSQTYYTQTYIVPPKGYTISNLTFFKPEIYGKNKYIASYDVLDKNGNIVSNYRRYYDVKSSGKVIENREVYNEGLENVDKNLEAVSVDFFQNKEDLKFEPYTVSVEGVNLQLSNWMSSFTEKLKYGRAKDLLDYANFIPNDVVPVDTKITPQQKQQATSLFSEFLDVYVQDFEQVEKILKEEKIIDKDCNGGGKLKAEKGLQTNFTKGGKWKIYEIFEGKSHKQGGIDINIKNNQISFTNKNGSIKAKYGLVISKDNDYADDGSVFPNESISSGTEDDYYINNKNIKVKKFFKNEQDRETYKNNLINLYENELKNSPSSSDYISKYRVNIFDKERNVQLDNKSMECIDCVSGIIKKSGYSFNSPSTKDGHYLGNMTFYDNVNAGKEDMYRVNGNFQVGDIVQTLSYKMGEKTSWNKPTDAKIITKIEKDSEGRTVYRMRGGSGGGRVSGSDMYEEDLKNHNLKLVTRPGYYLDKEKLQKERQGSEEIKKILEKKQQDLDLKLNENVKYNFKIKKDSPDYNDNTKEIMDYFIEFSNNPENIKELVRKTGESKKEIYDSLKNAFGILGQENRWEDRYVGGAYGIENTIDKIQQIFNTGDSFSQGIAQIKMNTINHKPKTKDGKILKSLAEIYEIEKNSDLSDIKKVLPLLVALDLQNKKSLRNWGNNNTLSEKLYGVKGKLKYEDIKDYGRLSPYLMNNYSNIANRTIKTPLGKTIKNDGSNPYIPLVKYKIDRGTYPAKVWEKWLKNIEVEEEKSK